MPPDTVRFKLKSTLGAPRRRQGAGRRTQGGAIPALGRAMPRLEGEAGEWGPARKTHPCTEFFACIKQIAIALL